MKHKKICNWLKAMIVLLGITGTGFLAVETLAALKDLRDGNIWWTYILTTWFVTALAYVVLALFWKVCIQIGRDNSFSAENALLFHMMCICGALAAAGFLVRIIYLSILCLNAASSIILISAVEVVVAVVFAVLCECMSKLIISAYEIKQENEYTI